MKRKAITRSNGNRLFHKGDKVHRRNIDISPMRGGIRI